MNKQLLKIENLLFLVPITVGIFQLYYLGNLSYRGYDWGISYFGSSFLDSLINWLLFFFPAWLVHYFLRVTGLRNVTIASWHVGLSLLLLLISFITAFNTSNTIPGWHTPVLAPTMLSFDPPGYTDLLIIAALLVQIVFVVYGIRRIGKWRKQLA